MKDIASLSSVLFDTLEAFVLVMTTNGSIVAINETIENTFGYSQAEIEGRPCWEVFRPRDDQDSLRELFDQLQTGQISEDEFPSGYEQTWLTRKGESRTVAWSNTLLTDKNGEARYVLGTGVDTTSQRMSEATLKAVLETAVDGIIIIDEEGYIQSFNRAAEEMFGYEASEVEGRKVNMLMPEPHHSAHDTYIDNYLETGEKQIIGVGREVPGKRKDGSTFPLRLAVSEVNVGGYRLFAGILHDLTEEHRLQREILRASEEERRRIGQDLHDTLGQMLNGIALLTETLAEQLEKEDHRLAGKVSDVADYAREADTLARHLARGLTPVDLEPGNLPGALRQLAKRVENIADVSVTVDAPPTLHLSESVATEQYRIAQEAVNNAIRHGNGDHITLTLQTTNKYVRLLVKDDGRGLPENFDLCEQEGMGLRTMQYRARINGGSLKVTTPPEGGTMVISTMPRPNETD